MIRHSRTEDIDEIVAIGRDANLSIWTPADYVVEFSRKGSICLTKTDDSGGVEGFLHGRISVSAITGEPVFELHNIGVRTDLRRIGVGSSLLAELRRKCVEKGIFQMILDVRVSNEKAIDFYKKHRFTVVSTEKAIYSSPKEDGYLMSCLL